MCGIWAVFGLQDNLYNHCANSFTKITHRGPDAWRIEYDEKVKNSCLGFHRLSIVDCIYGMQPMKLHAYPQSLLLCNGELYNCKRLGKQFDFKYETKCDVECIFHLYQKFGIEECVKNLDGVFAFCIVDVPNRKVFLGRDPYGVRPLFRFHSKNGVLGICSESKGLVAIGQQLNGLGSGLEPFPPGTFEEYSLAADGTAKFVRRETFHRPGDKPAFAPFVLYEELSPTDHLANIRTLLTSAVRKRLMADRRIGCFLSGGLDSSLIAALLVREARRVGLPYKIQSFACGMGDSPDIRAAREVAAFIGTEHHELVFGERDVEDALEQVVYHLETPDITTVRASVPMFLLAQYVKQNTDTTVVFSGEGADEVAQGYIYFRDAPDAAAAHAESLRLLAEIYLFDGLRADRTTSAHSLELRVPFLDLQFTNYYLNLPAELRQPKAGVEKHLLRSAFDGDNLLPHSILWRHKEAFSDGVASKKKSLFVTLQEIIEKRLTNVEEEAEKIYPHCTPKTKEALYYRKVFEKNYPKLAESFIPFFWMPRWVEGVTDPSARFIKHYAADAGDK